MSPIPDNVVDKRSHGSIHEELRRKARASGRLVREYKAADGDYVKGIT